MNKVDALLAAYKKQVSLQWDDMLSGPEKVWFCVYDPQYERRVRARRDEIKIATVQAGHTWQHIDITGMFETWLAKNEFREDYFGDSSLLRYEIDDFTEYMVDTLAGCLQSADSSTVVAVTGVGTLYGIVRASAVIDKLVRTTGIPGRLLFFFPGDRDGRKYRLLKARDGWNYLATPIEAVDE